MSRLDLPDFPWDSLTGARERAAAHPDGIVNLSVGTPVDPVAEVIRVALNWRYCSITCSYCSVPKPPRPSSLPS